jgi:hypothetical protein
MATRWLVFWVLVLMLAFWISFSMIGHGSASFELIKNDPVPPSHFQTGPTGP